MAPALDGKYFIVTGAGRDLDETFGLIETAEKAAEIYMKIAHLPRLNTITDQQLHLIEGRFGVKAREGWLDWSIPHVRSQKAGRQQLNVIKLSGKRLYRQLPAVFCAQKTSFQAVLLKIKKRAGGPLDEKA